jgi:hypothetical protein
LPGIRGEIRDAGSNPAVTNQEVIMNVDLDNQIFACMIFRVGEYTSEPLGYVVGTKKYIEGLTDLTADVSCDRI